MHQCNETSIQVRALVKGQASVREGFEGSGQCYETQEAAAAAAAKLLRTNIASLTLSPGKTMRAAQPRRYRFVDWDCARRMWQVKRKGHTCNDLYALTQDGAAKLAAKEFNCSLQQLRLQQPPKRTRQAKQKPRQYRFVYYDTRDKLWRVRRQGLVLARSFKTELQQLILQPKHLARH